MCDPLADASSYTAQKASHLIIAEKLHDALFTYLNKFSKSWHVDAANWKKNFQFLSATLFDRNKSGVCMIHMAHYFNVIGLATKLDNETLGHQKKLMAAELLQLDGNLAILPATLTKILHG